MKRGKIYLLDWIILILLAAFVFSGAMPSSTRAKEPVIYPVIPVKKGIIVSDYKRWENNETADRAGEGSQLCVSEMYKELGAAGGEAAAGEAVIQADLAPEEAAPEPEPGTEEAAAGYNPAESGADGAEDEGDPCFSAGSGALEDNTDLDYSYEQYASLSGGDDIGAEEVPDASEPLPELVEPELHQYKEPVETDGCEETGLTYLGTWTATAYCACPICCGSYASGYTASGTLATQGRTVACSDLEFGTQLLINDHVYTVEDRGVEGAWVDIYFESHEEALNFGMQQVEVYLVTEY